MANRFGRPGTASWPLYCCALIVAASVMVCSSGPDAAELNVSGQVYQQLGYSENIRLSTDNENDSALSITAGSVELRIRDTDFTIGLDGEASQYIYFQESDINTDNEYVRGFVEKESRRALLGAEASFRRDTSIVDQLDAGGERELDDERRLTFSIGPWFEYQLAPRTRLISRGQYRKREYPGSDRINFSFWNGNVGAHHSLTRRLTAGGDLSASYFDSKRQESSFVSPQAFLGYDYAERLNLSLSAGPSVTFTDTQRQTAAGLQSESDTTYGYAVGAGADLELGERTDVSLLLSRRVEPGGDDGEVAETTRLRAQLQRRLSRHLRFDLSTTLQRRVGVGDFSTFEDRNDAIVEPRLRWALTEQVDLSMIYRFRYRKFDDGDDASANALFLRLSYDVPNQRWNL